MLRGFEQMRYDRILLRSKKNTWQAESIVMLGTRKLEGSEDDGMGLYIYPSDHFGLLTTLQIAV